jgi:hypothetical protein
MLMLVVMLLTIAPGKSMALTTAGGNISFETNCEEVI